MEGKDIGQIDMLTRLAGEVGLNEKEFEEALRTRKYREAHRRALRHAYEVAGVTGVPMFVIGDRALTGLQDRETLEAVIEAELKAQGNAAQPA
jgi:predicted DsbA family dithiol-disulfide isomerase